MRVTTFQYPAVVDALTLGQSLEQEACFIDEAFVAAYAWMRGQMVVSGRPPPNEKALLIWGWPEGHEPGEDTLSPKERANCLRVTLDLAEADVLLSDFHAWHVVLHAQYLGSDAADAAAPTLPHEDSWARIFTPDALEETYWGARRTRIYQACFWQPSSTAIISVSALDAPEMPRPCLTS